MDDEDAKGEKYTKDKGKLVALLLKLLANENDTKEKADASRDYCKLYCGSSHRDMKDLVTEHVEEAFLWLRDLKKIDIDDSGQSWMKNSESKAQQALYGQHTRTSETSRRRKPTLYDAYGVLRESKIGQSNLTHIASWGNAGAPAYRAILVKREESAAYIGNNDLFRAYSNLLLESSRMQLASIFYSRGTRPLEGFTGINHTIKLLSTLSTLIAERMEAEACGKMATVLATYVVETIKRRNSRPISSAAADGGRAGRSSYVTHQDPTNISSQGSAASSGESTRLSGQRCHHCDESSSFKTNSLNSQFTKEQIHVVIAAGESGTLRKSQSSTEADTLLLDFGGQVISVVHVKRDSEMVTVEAFGNEVRSELDRLFVLAASLGATKTSPRGCETTKFTEELSTSGLSPVSSNLTWGSQLAGIKRAFHDQPFQFRDFYSMNEKIFIGGVLPCITCAALYIALTAFYVSHILLKGHLEQGLSDRNDELSLSFWLSVILPELSFRYASLSRWYRQDEWATPVVLAKWIAASDLGVKAYHRTVRISVFAFFGFFSSIVFASLHLAVVYIKLILAMAVTIYVFRWAVNVASMQKAYNRAIELSQQINIVSEPGVFGQMSEYLENALCGSQVLKWGYVVVAEMTQLESWFRPACYSPCDSSFPMKRLGCGVVERNEIQRVIPFDIKPLMENLVGHDQATLGGELCPITGMWGAEQAVAIRKYLKDDDGPDKLRQALREIPPSVRTLHAQGSSFDLHIMSLASDAKSHTQIIQLAARGAYVRGKSRPLRGALVGDRSSVHERNLTRFHMCESRRAAIEWCVRHKTESINAIENEIPRSKHSIFAVTSESMIWCVIFFSLVASLVDHLLDRSVSEYGVPKPIFVTCFSCLGYFVTALGYDCLDAYTSHISCWCGVVIMNVITFIYLLEETVLQFKTQKARDNGHCTRAIWLWSIELVNISNVMVFSKCARTTARIQRNRGIILLETDSGEPADEAGDLPICKQTKNLDLDAPESCLHGPSFCGKTGAIPSFWEEKFDQNIFLE